MTSKGSLRTCEDEYRQGENRRPVRYTRHSPLGRHDGGGLEDRTLFLGPEGLRPEALRNPPTICT